MPNSTLRIATRKSRLALWQANWVMSQLEKNGHSCQLVLVETQGDQQQVAFRQMQGQGFFTKAVQDQLLSGQADIAVHSLKDLPSLPCEGLSLAAIPPRADFRECLLVSTQALDETAPALPVRSGAVVGTSAVRRQAQLAQLRPDLEVRELRGNVPTRVQKLRNGDYDAIVLAAAGLQRLELELDDLHVFTLEPEQLVPAPGQGALGIECREEDTATRDALQCIHDAPSARVIQLERGLMRRFDGGCQLALGAFAQINDQGASLLAWFGGEQCLLQGAQDEALVESMFRILSEPQTPSSSDAP